MQNGNKGWALSAKLALVGAGVAAGAVTATTLGANAATVSGSGTTSTAASSSSSLSSSSSAPAAPAAPSGRAGDRHGPGMGRGDEKAPSTAIAAKLRAAALKAVPGGTVDRVETDSGDAVYEAHMTKSDGTRVTVKFDKVLAVTAVEAGMGK